SHPLFRLSDYSVCLFTHSCLSTNARDVMKREKREACNSKLWLCIASLICCCVYFAYYQALTIEVSSAVDLAISFDRDDVPSSLYGVCPLSRAADSHPITDFKRRNCTKSLPLTYLDKKGRIVVNKTVDEKIRKSCYARALNDRTSWPWTWLKAIAVFFIRNNKLFWYNSDEVDKIEDDLVEVECLGYNNFHGRVRRSEKIPIRFNASSDLFIIHVRSFRSNVFTPHTTRFLEEALSAVHFHNYQSLGDDYADFGAILAGGLATPLSREWMGRREVPTNLPRSYYDDPCFATRTSTFLPRVFQQEGYATLIADENNIQESGFERGCGWEPSNLYTPVLHRFPPKPGCSYASRVLEYFERFVEVYDASAKFVVLRILHDDSVVDEELLSFFKRLKKRLDKAYVFFIADVPGSTNPSPITTPTQNLWISLPKALRDALAMANLLANQHVLTHSFDVHETLRARARMIHGSSVCGIVSSFYVISRDTRSV
ncbi:hypothetical protein PMAYCL1PPCAC_04652, partial [Pristionchus mayeri]